VEALTPLGPQANDRPGQVQIELLQIAPVPSTYRSIPRWNSKRAPFTYWWINSEPGAVVWSTFVC
jgi:hypothetical protein